jgi:Tol biopolymer transport system component
MRALVIAVAAVLVVLLLATVTGGRTHAERVVFADQGSNLLLVLDPTDGTTQRLAHTPIRGDSPAPSPDGAAVAFTGRRRMFGGFSGPDTDPADFDPGIWVADTRTGRVHRLTRNSQDRDPAWSPDGRLIAFVREVRLPDQTVPSMDVFVIRLDGSGLRQLTVDGLDEAHPSWAPDGRSLVVAATGRLAGSPLLVVPVTGGKARRVVADGGEPAWSPDGRTIAFTRSVTDGTVNARGQARHVLHVFTVAATGGAARDITPRNRSGSMPAWSADGSLLVSAGDHLVTLRPDGSGLRGLLGSRQRLYTWPAWIRS